MTTAMMKLPANFVEIQEEEMVYLEGGATVTTNDAYQTFLNVGKVFNYIARVFSAASSIINNVNVIITSIQYLNSMLAPKNN